MAARGALARGALALGALALGARAEGGFPTPEGYAELPSAEDCRGPGCDSLRMSGKELLERWWTTPEGGKHWFHAVNPLQKQAKDLGENSLREQGLTQTVDGLGGFELADAILKHLADLEDKVEAEHERLTGEPVVQASRHEKAERLLVAHREETGTAYEKALGIALEGEEKEYFTSLHVNVYHQMTGYLRWPHYDWRPVPSPPEAGVACDRDMAGIYVISLVKRTDRREALEAAMPAKLSYSYIDAVDGSTLTDSKFDQLIYQGTIDDANPMAMGLVPSTLMLWQDIPNPYFEYYWETKIKKGEVGLNLSLKKALGRALIDGREAALISARERRGLLPVPARVAESERVWFQVGLHPPRCIQLVRGRRRSRPRGPESLLHRLVCFTQYSGGDVERQGYAPRAGVGLLRGVPNCR